MVVVGENGDWLGVGEIRDHGAPRAGLNRDLTGRNQTIPATTAAS